MDAKRIYIGIIFVLITMPILSCMNEKQNLLKNFIIPIYKGAYAVNQEYDNKNDLKILFYKIKAIYPALNVIEFYKFKFHEMNLVPYYEDGYGSMLWEDFDVTKGTWEKTNQVPARYIATWVDSKRTIRIVLHLRYEYKYNEINKDEWKSILLVSCVVHPFFDFRDIERQMKGKELRE